MALSLIEVRPLWNERIAETLRQLGNYQWIVFTSGNGVELFFALLREQSIDLRWLMQVKFAVIGRKTAEILLLAWLPEWFCAGAVFRGRSGGGVDPNFETR